MTFAADEDDLATLFPLITTPPPLPKLSERVGGYLIAMRQDVHTCKR